MPIVIDDWLHYILPRRPRATRKTDSFFIIDDSLDEEDGYLPSGLNIDDFLSQSGPRHQPSYLYSVLLPWIACVAFGTLLGAIAFCIHLYAPVDSIVGVISNTYSGPQHRPFQSLSAASLRNTLLAGNLWNYTNPPPSPCGNSPVSARAAGCRFGPMSFAWYPVACYDVELEVAFLALADWKWYSEPEIQDSPNDWSTSNATSAPWKELPRHDVLLGMHEKVYVNPAYHVAQCDFAQRKLWRAIMGKLDSDVEQILLDNYIVNSWNEKSCARRQIDEVQPSMEVVKYLDCLRL